jgi:CotH kinase protein/Concanavalin A-like lectin/glucanases superfamily/Fn3 associated/Lamin Tail Domain/PA14 domain
MNNALLSRTLIAALAITSTAHAGLLGYWTFDDDLLTDKSGKGYHAAQPGAAGSPTGAAVAATFSTDVAALPLRAGATTAKSLDLTGGNKAVFVTTGGTESEFNFPGSRFTISYWFKTWPVGSAAPHIAKGGETYGGLAQGWQARRNSFTNDLAFTTRGVGANSGELNTSGATPGVKAAGIWQHVALVYDGAYKHMYVNGVQVRSEAAANQSLVATASKLTFGARQNAATGAWESFSQCRLDDVAIFDNALTAAEVEDIARGADPRLPLRTTVRPFSFGTAASAPTLPEGGPGYIGMREIRVNGQTFPGTTNAQVFVPADAVMYLRTFPTVPAGAAVVVDKNGASVPLQTQIDFTDPESGSTGANAAAAPFLTNLTGSAQDHFLQTAQGCFQVNTPGKYTFIMKGNEGMNFAIMGVNWEKIVSSNGAGSVSGEVAQAGLTTGDSNVIAVIDLPAGKFNWRYLWNDQTGSAWNEVFYSPGDLAAYGATFKQLGDPSGGLQLVDHVPIANLTVSNQFVIAGSPANVTLTWDAAYATTVTLNGGAFSNQDVTASTVKGLGSITTASPAVTTTYTVTATRGAESVAKSVTVLVDQPPVVNSFTADDVEVPAGQQLVFRWNVVGQGSAPNSVTISDGVTTTDVTANTSISGSGTLTTITAPATTTVYTLTASNAINSSNAQLTITVGNPPVFTTFTGDNSIEPDSAVTFTYEIAGNPTSATFSPNASGTVLTLPNGQITERPAADTIYQMSATNAYGTTLSPQINVQIIQPPQSIGVSSATWTLTLYKSLSTQISNLTQAQQLIDNAIARGPVTVGGVSTPTPITITNQPVVNLTDGADGAIGGGTWPTANWGAAAIDDFAVRATAVLVVNDSDSYTLNINNDDGGRLRIDLNNNGSFNDAGETIINDDVLAGPHTVTVEKFLSAGSYPIEYVYFERGGGAEGEVFYTNDQGQNVLIAAIPPTTAPITFPDLRIVEFMANNNTGLQDGQGDREDWIEIYNGTGAPRSLAGYYLTDDVTMPNKWAFPTTPAHTMASGEYFVVFASSKAITLPGDEYHTNFKLDPQGEYLALTKDDGMGGFTVVQEFNPFPPQAGDISYGLYDTEHYVGFFRQTTPRKRNFGGYAGFVIGETQAVVTQGAVTLHNRGFYSSPITVTLTKDDPNAIVRYTTDGSTPSNTVGTIYTTPLAISGTTVLRSAAIRPNYIGSDVDTHTFIYVSDVITQTNAQAVARGWPNAGDGPNGQDLEYAMSTSVVTGNQAATMAALQAIPTISIVTDLSNLVNPSSGIYVNPSGRGRAFERPASMELLNDLGNGVGNFQKDMGLRVRGGFSRSVDNPKHAWHFYFRNEYSGDLRYPMFGAEGAADFEQLDLQCPQNYSWSFSPQNNNYAYTAPGGASVTLRLRYNTFVREPVSRDLYGDMGQPYPRTRHYHCYVNGVYWGLYMSQERAEASFGQTYLGGDKDNYDVVKSAGNAAGYNTEATDGTFTQGTSATPGSAWAKLWWRTNELRNPAGQTEATRRASYFELMGLDPNGVPYNDPVNHPVVLDVDSLIDYMIITWYCGSFDAPLSTFLNSASNNWFGMRDRLGNRGFVYFPHDFEHGFGTDLQTGDPNRSTDRTGPWGGNGTNYKGQTMYNQLGTYTKSNPEYFHENLASCLEYRVRFWDRAHRHLTRPGGALLESNVLATIDARAAVVRSAILAESARWGDQKGVAASDFMPAPWDESITQFKDWVRQGTNAEYIASIPTSANPTGTQGLGRGGRLIVQLRAYQDKLNLSDASNTALPLYSPLNAPTFSSYGGVVAAGTNLTITNPNAGTTLYWSLNGTDPRLIGGGINPSPSVQTGASPAVVTLNATGKVMARAYNVASQTWSGLQYADFIVGTPASAASLVITEINYNPKLGAPGTPAAGDIQSFEFIEFQNISSSTTIDLTNVRFTNGLTYTFPTGRLLTPGERIVVVRDIAAFQSRYPDASYPGLSSKTVGPWTGGLDNGGELLTVVDTYGATITALTYDDDLPWPAGPDGAGATAVFTTTNPAAANASDGNNWFAHGVTHGNPGGPDIGGYAAWAAANGASVSGDADTDFDSVKDVIEYILGTNPTASSSVDKLPVPGRQNVTVLGVPGEYLTLSFTRAGGTGDVAVVCESNNNLLAPANWLPNAVLVSRTYEAGGSETFVFRHPNPISGDLQQYLRIKVTNQ